MCPCYYQKMLWGKQKRTGRSSVGFLSGFFLFCFVLIYKNNRRSQLKYKNKARDSVEVFPCVHAHFPKVKCRSDLNVLPQTIVCGGLDSTTHPLSEERRVQIPLPVGSALTCRGTGTQDFPQEPGDVISIEKQHQKKLFPGTVAWPSGLRRWIKAPVSPGAWVRIPPLPACE